VKKFFLGLGYGFLWFGVSIAAAKPPECADKRLVIELVAKEPEIVTPTGLAVDEHGRIWVIENHTHQRPADYPGPASDRIRVFEDFDGQGRPRKITTFADGFRDAMSIALKSDGAVYLATRSDIHLLEDKTGRGQVDKKKSSSNWIPREPTRTTACPDSRLTLPAIWYFPWVKTWEQTTS